MCHCMQLMGQLVGTFEDNVEQWAGSADAATGRRDIENLINLGIGFFQLIDDTCKRIGQTSANGPAPAVAQADADAMSLKRETAAMFARFLKPGRVIENAFRNLRNQVGDVEGAERFLGCLHEAECRVRRWEDDQTAAMKLRAQWLEQAGVGEEEIRDLCDPSKYPADLQEERANVEAAAKLVDLQLTPAQWQKLTQERAGSARCP